MYWAYEERFAICMEGGDVHPLHAHMLAMTEAIEANELRLKVIYAVPTQERRPIIAGKARVDHNELRLEFCQGILDQITKGILRPFIFVAAHLDRWPELPGDLASRRLETSIWANPRGKTPDRRPLAWEGWPIRPDLVLLRPAVDLQYVQGFEDKQSGFVVKLPEVEEEPPHCPVCEAFGVTTSCHRCGWKEGAAASTPVEKAPETLAMADPDDSELASQERLQKATWGEQVAFIREQLAKGSTEAKLATYLSLPLTSIEAAKTWVAPPPAPKKKKKPKKPRALL